MKGIVSRDSENSAGSAIHSFINFINSWWRIWQLELLNWCYNHPLNLETRRKESLSSQIMLILHSLRKVQWLISHQNGKWKRNCKFMICFLHVFNKLLLFVWKLAQPRRSRVVAALFLEFSRDKKLNRYQRSLWKIPLSVPDQQCRYLSAWNL